MTFPGLEYLRHIEQKQREELISADKTTFLSSDEAAKFGIEIEPDWMVKVVPQPEGKFDVSYITPEKWEIKGEDLFISPGGKQYTAAELEDLYAPAEAPTEAVAEPEKYVPFWERGVAPPKMFAPARAPEFQYPAGVPQQLGRETVSELIDFAIEDPEGFNAQLLEAGRNADTENLLKMFGATDTEIDEIFGLAGIPPEGSVVPLENPETGEIKEAIIMPDYSIIVDGSRVGEYDLETGEFVPDDPLWKEILAYVHLPFQKYGMIAAEPFIGGYSEEQRRLREELAVKIKGLDYSIPEDKAEIIRLNEEYAKRIEALEPERAEEYGERYKALPWWAQILFELPAYMAIPSGVQVTRGIAPLTVKGGGIGLGARIVVRGLRPLVRVETSLANMANKVASKPLQAILRRKWTRTQLKELTAINDEATKVVIRQLDDVLRENPKLAAQVTRETIGEIAWGMRQMTTARPHFARTLGRQYGIVGFPEEQVVASQATKNYAKFVLEWASPRKPEFAVEALTRAGYSYEAIQKMTVNRAWTNIAESLGYDGAIALIFNGYGGLNQVIPVKTPANYEPPTEPPIMPSPTQIPPTDEIVAASLEPNIYKSLLSAAGKLPGGESIVRAIDPRALVPQTPQTVDQLASMYAIAYREILKVGQGIKALAQNELRAITTNPVKLFRFNEDAFSASMVKRLYPRYKGEEEAGTLEHIFTQPEKYNMTDQQLNYVATVNRINKQIVQRLKEEGVIPEEVAEKWQKDRWIHRVVEGRYLEDELVAVRGRPGRRGKFAVTRAFEMRRKAPTMYEGMVWGIKYAKNPEIYVTTFMEEAYAKIANMRFYEAFDKGLEALGKAGLTPTDVLRQRFPQVVDHAEAMVERSKDLGNFHKLISRAIRGETPAKQTLNAIQRRFPELGMRFRSLVSKPANEIKQLRELLLESKKQIDLLNKQLKAKAVKPETIKPVEMPDESKLEQAFEVMTYEDRQAFLSTMEGQIEELGATVSAQDMELSGINEFLKTDPVASFKVTRSYKTAKGITVHRTMKLIDVLVEGQFPESVTLKQAAFLMMKPEEQVLNVVKGRVKREFVLDQLAEHFNMEEQVLIDHIENIAVQKQTAEDLRQLIGMANSRVKDVKRLIEILNRVDSKPAFTPSAEGLPLAVEGMPEAGLQKDMFGYTHPVYPQGKGEIVQLKLEDYNKLVELRKSLGLPAVPPDVAIKPPMAEGETVQFQQVKFDVPTIPTIAERKVGLEALRKQVKLLVQEHKPEYWRAKYERVSKMEAIRQSPGIGKGFIQAPHFGGKIYDQDVIDTINGFFGHEKGSTVLRYASNTAGILRVTKAAMDYSYMGIQGLPAIGLAFSYMATNPIKGTKMMAQCLKATFAPIAATFDMRWMYSYLNKFKEPATQRINLGGSSAAVDIFEQAKLLGFIPGKPYQRFELAFYGAGEIIRNSFWELMAEEAIKNGNEYQLARFLDRLTGIISTEAMGVPLKVRQLESSFIWFAPRYTRACLTLLANCFRGGYTGAKARRALGGMIAAGVLFYSTTRYSMSRLQGKDHEEAWRDVQEGFGVVQDPITGEYDWQPSAKFMSFQIGNFYFGVGGFWYGLLRLAGNIMATIEEVGDREVIDLVRIMKHGSLNRDNPFISWWYSRSSPFVGFAFEAGWPLLKSTLSGELKAGSDYLGYPIETWQDYLVYLTTRFEPIWMEQGLNPYIPYASRDNEIPEGMAKIIVPLLEIFGFRSFPEGGWTKFYDKVYQFVGNLPEEELRKYFTEEEMVAILKAQSEGRLGWKQLPDPLQQKILAMYPELKELYEQALSDSGLRSSDNWKQWEAQTEAERSKYYDYGNSLVDRLQNSEIDTRELRDLWSEAGQNYGVGIEILQQTPYYQEIYDYFEKRRAEGTKYDWNLDVALMEYQDIIFTEYLDENGDIDWDARDLAVQGYIEKWGEEIYRLIREMYGEKKLLEGLDPLLIRLADDKDKLGREYWQLPFKLIYKMDEEDVPAEYYGLWQQYQALETDTAREQFLEANPDFAKDWRAEYRLNNPEADAMLALWGYSGKLQTREAYDLVTRWGRELGIPLEQMGLGLPPPTLIDKYFKLNDIVKETSGNSVETKLYLLTEGSNYFDWLLEQGIRTDDLSDESIPQLKLRVKWTEEIDTYESFGDKTSENYIEDDTLRREKRDDFLTANPIFADDRRRIEAYDKGITDIDKYVEYYNLPDKGQWRERYLIDPENADFKQAMYDLGILTEDIIPEKIKPELYDQIKLDYESQFDEYGALTNDADRDAYLSNPDNADFALAWRKTKGMEYGITEQWLDDYVSYYEATEKPEGYEWVWYEDDWFLMEHKDYYENVWLGILGNKPKDFDKLPSRDFWKTYTNVYTNLPTGKPRLDYRARNLWFDKEGVKLGYWKSIEDRGSATSDISKYEEVAAVREFLETLPKY